MSLAPTTTAPPAVALPAKPRLRGMLHVVAFPVSVVTGGVLLLAVADSPAERRACLVYTLAAATLAAPAWLYTPFYAALGWVAVAVLPDLAHAGGGTVTALIVLGGLAYSAGGVVYALRRPDPVPTTFGYHEIFHAGTIVGFGCHYAAVALAVG